MATIRPHAAAKISGCSMYGLADFGRGRDGNFLYDQAEQSTGKSARDAAYKNGGYIGQQGKRFVGVAEVGVVADKCHGNQTGDDDGQQSGTVSVENIFLVSSSMANMMPASGVLNAAAIPAAPPDNASMRRCSAVAECSVAIKCGA